MRLNIKNNTKAQRSLLLLCTVAAILGSCSTLEGLLQIRRPEVTVEKVEIIGLSFDQAELLFSLSVHNPNPIGVQLAGLDYRLMVEDKQLLQSSLNQGIALDANAESPLSVPVSIRYVDLFSTVQSAREQDELGYQMNLDLGFSIPGYGTLTVPLSHTGKIPVPRLPSIGVSSLRIKKLGFSSVELDLDLEVENTNSFDMALHDFSYRLNIAGRPWVEGTAQHGFTFGKKSKSIASIPVRLNIAELGRSVIELLSGSQKLEYEFSGSTNIDSSLLLLKNYPFSFSSSGDADVLR